MSHDFSPNPGKWLTLGIVGLAISLIGFFVDTQIAAWSYLIGLIFVTSIAIGMLFLVMIHHIFDAYWSVIVRRQAEHYLSALPYLGILYPAFRSDLLERSRSHLALDGPGSVSAWPWNGGLGYSLSEENLVVVRGFFLVSGGILLRRMDLLRSYLPKKFVFPGLGRIAESHVFKPQARCSGSDFGRLDVDGSRLRLDHEFGIPLVLHHVWRLDVRQRNESGNCGHDLDMCVPSRQRAA